MRRTQSGRRDGGQEPDHLPGLLTNDFHAVGVAFLLGHHETCAAVETNVQKSVLDTRPIAQVKRDPAGNIGDVGQAADDNEVTIGVADCIVGILQQALQPHVPTDQIAVDRPTGSGQGTAAHLIQTHQVVTVFQCLGAAGNGIRD